MTSTFTLTAKETELVRKRAGLERDKFLTEDPGVLREYNRRIREIDKELSDLRLSKLRLNIWQNQ